MDRGIPNSNSITHPLSCLWKLFTHETTAKWEERKHVTHLFWQDSVGAHGLGPTFPGSFTFLSVLNPHLASIKLLKERMGILPTSSPVILPAPFVIQIHRNEFHSSNPLHFFLFLSLNMLFPLPRTLFPSTALFIWLNPAHLWVSESSPIPPCSSVTAFITLYCDNAFTYLQPSTLRNMRSQEHLVQLF